MFAGFSHCPARLKSAHVRDFAAYRASSLLVHTYSSPREHPNTDVAEREECSIMSIFGPAAEAWKPFGTPRCFVVAE